MTPDMTPQEFGAKFSHALAMEHAVTAIIKDVCELPDYTSPDDNPNLLQCTVEELTLILRRHLLGEDEAPREEWAKGLSRQQIEALRALPFSMTYWGGRPFHSWSGKFTDRTVRGLVSRGLVRAKRGERLDTDYDITDAGRAALEQKGRPPRCLRTT